MPFTSLWALDTTGQPYHLSTAKTEWHPCGDRHTELKRISAAAQSVWALGGDQQIYLYVPSSDLPIRVQENTFENQRWRPLKYGGWTDQLIFSDRPNFSSADGKKALRKEHFRLPSSAWEWEGDWHIQESIDGQLTGPEGWMYAVDFPRPWHIEQQWKSTVRRRKWIRFRKFVRFNTWIQVPAAADEPFIDVAVGGSQISGVSTDHLSVWAVTISGKIFVRRRISQMNPEGNSWTLVPGLVDCEVNQISVGPTGLVWAVTWNGRILSRFGITKDCLIGTAWYVVPDPSVKIEQVTVGGNAAWAIGAGGSVWFRKNICGAMASTDVEACIGTGWVEMIGCFQSISIGLNDQVLGINMQDKKVYFRTQVTPGESCGKLWQKVKANRRLQNIKDYSETSSFEDSYSVRSEEEISSVSTAQLLDQSDLFFNTSGTTSYLTFDTANKTMTYKVAGLIPKKTAISKTASVSHKATGLLPRSIANSNTSAESSSEMSDLVLQRDAAEDFTDAHCASVDCDNARSRHSSWSSTASDTMINFCEDKVETPVVDFPEDVIPSLSGTELVSAQPLKSETTCIDKENSNLSSSQKGIEDELSSSSSNLDVSNISDSQISLNLEEAHEASWLYDDNAEFQWMSISASACDIDPKFPPATWFSSSSRHTSLDHKKAKEEKWYSEIVLMLKERNAHEARFIDYEQAVEKTSWIKRGSVQVYDDYSGWVDCTAELELCSSRYGTTDGTLTCIYSKPAKVIQIPLGEVTCVLRVSDFNKYSVLAVYTARRIAKSAPLKVAVSSDSELEDWMKELSSSCYELRNAHPPERDAVWALTSRGDIFVHNVSLRAQSCRDVYWYQVKGHMHIIESSNAGVVWGIGYDKTAWVYTGFIDSAEELHKQCDTRTIYIYENQRWNPVTGYSLQYRIPTDRAPWTDQTGRQEMSKETAKPPSVHWQFISDWAIDYSTPGGTDKEGWQYASDFPRPYHKRKRIACYVRRRRWFRKCKLTTNGPWLDVDTVKLNNVSIQIDAPTSVESEIAVWAVDYNGNVLCRVGVTLTAPRGSTWIHVPADQCFTCICVGSAGRIWGVAKDGSAFLRNGVTQQEPTGSCWFQVAPPRKEKLSQVSVGELAVWAVDCHRNLYYRKDVMPLFPEGTEWRHLCGDVRHVSVGPKDQVWVIMDFTNINGAVCRRKNVNKENPMGTGWDVGIRGGWHYVTARGCVDSMKVQSSEAPTSTETC